MGGGCALSDSILGGGGISRYIFLPTLYHFENMGGRVPSPRSLKNDHTIPYLSVNFQTNKGMELIKTKSFFFTSLEKNRKTNIISQAWECR